jgi:hypothetical protein
MRTIAVAILVVIVTGEASAQQPQAAWMGAGTSTCAEYAQAYRRDPDDADNTYFNWAQGFMSGLNEEQRTLKKPAHNLKALPISEQLDYLRLFCDQKPLLPYAAAVLNLFRALPSVSK